VTAAVVRNATVAVGGPDLRAAFTSLAAYRSQRLVGPIMSPAMSCSTGCILVLIPETAELLEIQ
jgi:hypothetical protein